MANKIILDGLKQRINAIGEKWADMLENVL